MNRRDFTRSLMAGAALPALPMGALAGAPAKAAVTSPLPNLYTWSAMIARTQGACSPQMLARHLNIDVAQAQALCGRLVQNGIVAPGNVFGLSKALEPIKPPPRVGPPQSLANSPKDLRDWLPHDTTETSDSLPEAGEPATDLEDSEE